jgi:dTDP-4-dehydrorhamnose reductase
MTDHDDQRHTFLVIGKNGQLANALMQQGVGGAHIVKALSRDEADLASNTMDWSALLKHHQPAVVINAAAYTAVDAAESNQDEAMAINAHGPERLAQACAEQDIPLIHISTDYVFDGRKEEAWNELDPVKPINFYGFSKERGEHAIRQKCEKHVILRTSWVMSAHGQNFLKTMLRLSDTRPEISVVNDQFGCPTFASDLASAILDICARLCNDKENKDLYGTFHLCGQGKTHWANVARTLFILAGREISVREIPSIEYPTPARRPKNSVLNCEKIESVYGIKLPHWQQSLTQCIPALTGQLLSDIRK